MEELLKQILQGINEIKEEQAKQGTTLKEQGERLDRIDKKLKSQNDILQSFKFDTDLLIEKNAKLEFKVNSLEKRFEA
jgi:DNA repair ATPase RecN